MTIKFYKTGQAYDIFSNVTDLPVKVNINGNYIKARSSEAIYQGFKGVLQGAYNNNSKIYNDGFSLINSQQQPGSHLQQAGKNFNSPVYFKQYDQYQTVRERIMQEILEMKFSQNPMLAKALLNTSGQYIIENTQINTSYNDQFWGNGWNGKGNNSLGKLLMKIRNKFQSELKQNGFIRERVGFSQNLSQYLGVKSYQFSGNKLYSNTIKFAPSITTVAQLKNNSNTSNKQFTPSYSNNTKAKVSALKYVANAIQNKFGKNIAVKFAPDIYKSGQFVLKISCSYNQAQSISNAVGGGKIVSNNTGSNILILGNISAKSLFYKLGIGKYGKTAKHNTFDSLKYDFNNSSYSNRNRYVS